MIDPEGHTPHEDIADWSLNYFNYFTEIEEHFRRARGTSLFLLSPLDWALIDNWRTSGVSLEAVTKGIDDAFASWRSRKNRRQSINSVAYCAQAVMDQAKRSGASGGRTAAAGEAPFSCEELTLHLNNASARLRKRHEPPLLEVATALELMAANPDHYLADLESLEQRLSAMEDKAVAALRASQSEEDLFAIRQALDAELRPYRGKMSAEQLAMLERRYLDTALLERAALLRLSLFYIR